MSVVAVQKIVKDITQQHCRGVLLLSGEQSWVLTQVQQLTQLLNDVLWMGAAAGDNVTAVDIGAGKQFLGSELGHVVVNTFSGVHPNSLAAVSGAIKAGGLLILLTPPLVHWASRPDADYQRLQVEGFTNTSQLFLARFCKVLSEQSSLAVWPQGEAIRLPRITKTQRTIGLSPYKSEAQQAACAAIVKVATGHRRRPLLITAKRGRGKSASLGLAASQLIAQHGKHIIVCAPSQAAVGELMKFITTSQQSHITFYTVEAMQRLQPQADLVLVDEAAGIPVPILKQWLQRYSRIVFSSTNYGYEGYGQGFSLRFVKALEELTPQFKQLELDQAIRWQTPDPLEQSLDAALLLNAQLAQPLSNDGAATFSVIKQADLAANETLLEQVYALLVGAHYQTTPDDLRVLLDGPNISLIVAQRQSCVVGVLMLAQEGKLPLELQSDICGAKRRVKGHLAPQLVAVNTGSKALLNQQVLRVVRIAVHPLQRRQGIATSMLNMAEAIAKKNKLDALCAVFGFTAELLPFWQAAGFVPLTLSTRKDNASGAFSGCVYKGLNAPALASQQTLLAQLPRQLMFACSDYLASIDVDTLLAVLRCCSVPLTFSEFELSQLNDFALANKPLETCLPVLLKAAVVLPAIINNSGENEALRLLIMRLLLKWPVATMVEQSTISGKHDLNRELRQLLANFAVN